jgi:hypothetical protein
MTKYSGLCYLCQTWGILCGVFKVIRLLPSAHAQGGKIIGRGIVVVVIQKITTNTVLLAYYMYIGMYFVFHDHSLLASMKLRRGFARYSASLMLYSATLGWSCSGWYQGHTWCSCSDKTRPQGMFCSSKNIDLSTSESVSDIYNNKKYDV